MNDGHQFWHSITAGLVQAGSIGNGVISGSSVISGLSTQFAAIAVNNGHQLWQVAAPMNVSNLVPTSGLVLVGDAKVKFWHLIRLPGIRCGSFPSMLALFFD